MTFQEQLVEAAARAIATDEWCDVPSRSWDVSAEEWYDSNKTEFEKYAKAALTAILERMQSPSEAMIKAADEVAGTINPIDGYFLALGAINE